MMLGCTKRELTYRMSAAEMQEWWVYYQMSPWGEERADIRAGMMSALMVNIWAPRKGARAKPIDFIPDYFAPHAKLERQSPEEMYQTLLMFTKMAGGTVNEPVRTET